MLFYAEMKLCHGAGQAGQRSTDSCPLHVDHKIKQFLCFRSFKVEHKHI